jgi:hypothetical protein
MNDDAPGLEVGFLIDTGASYDELIQLGQLMDSTEARALKSAKEIERATGGMINVGNSVIQMEAVGTVATRVARDIAREKGQAERAGERFIRQVERENAAFGKSRSEQRAVRAETLALAAAKSGLGELASRIRAEDSALAAKELTAARAARFEAEAAAEERQLAADRAVAAAAKEAQALRAATNAHMAFEAAARRGAAAMREQEATSTRYERDLAELRQQLDPVAASQARVNQQIEFAAEAMRRGDISAAQFQARSAQLKGSLEQVETASAATRAGMTNLGFQIQDITQGLAMGVSPFTILAQQGGQVASALQQIFEASQPVAGAVGATAGAITGLNTAATSAKSSTLQLAGADVAAIPATNALSGAATVEAGALGGVAAGANAATAATQRFTLASRLATFAAGPLGAGVIALVSVLGMFAFSSRKGTDSSDALKLSLDIQKNSYDVLTNAVREYNATQQDSAALTRAATDEAKRQTLELIKQAKAQLAAAEAAYFNQSANSKGGLEIKAALGSQIGAAEAKLQKLQGELREIEKGLANQAVEARMNKEVEIATRYGRLLNNLSAAYDNGKKSVADYRVEREKLLRLHEKELEVYRSAKREEGRAGPSASAVATRDARVGDMVALIKSLFPGARITSTTGGQHTKGSDHYAGRAIDFVPGGGMGKYTTAEVEQILKDAGVDIRRNARGTQQLFGPGRAASRPGDHDDHFHLAWQGSPDTSKVDEQKARALEEARRAYELVVTAAKEYAAAQREEAATVGLSAKELRQYADAAAIAKAPTAELKKAIVDAAAARETAISAQAGKDFEANVLQPLRDELALYGLTGPARDAAALDLEKQAFMARHVAEGVGVAEQRWKQYYDAKSALIAKDAAQDAEVKRLERMRAELERMTDAARTAGDAIANAFGRVGGAVADAIDILMEYERRQEDIDDRVRKNLLDRASAEKESSALQLQGMTALTGATKNLFREHSAAYKAMAAAEKAFALVQLANTAVNVAAGASKMFATLGPWAFPAVAAMLGVMASLGFSKGGSAKAPDTNQGTGTVLGDPGAKSESIKRAIDALRDVDTVMLSYSRQMANSLRTIENNIQGFASLIVRNGEIGTAAGVKEGFNSNAGTVLAGVGMVLGGPIGAGIGALLTKIPIVGDILKGLFGTKTTVLGSGLSGGAQSIGDILAGGYDAQTYVDVQKKKKLFGITTSNKTSTQYSAADPMLENQFALILREFNNAIVAAAGPLGAATADIQNRLNGFVFSIGKINLQGLTGAEIEERLTAVFGAAADNMARAAFPGMERFQRAGEGLFETLVRVASIAESVTASFDLLGRNASGMTLDTKVALADQFENIGALTSAVDAYFSAFYTKEEQAAARTAQMGKVFESLGMAMPSTLAGFRQLVEAQDLNTAAGREAYAMLLKLAPAFADLQSAMEGAKSAADIAAERQDLERQLLELRGDTAALRALQLAKLDASNRELQQQIWAIQDAQAAAKAADELRKAWQSVSDTLMDEVRRIRGLTDTAAGGGFASLMGQFNAATSAARSGDMDAAKSLPQLSQALLAAAADAATSRQELDRVRAQIAASLEATNGLIGGLAGSPAATNAALLNAAAASQPGTAAVNDNGSDSLAAKFDAMKEELGRLRADMNSGNAAIASGVNKVGKHLDNVTSRSGGEAVSVEIEIAA